MLLDLLLDPVIQNRAYNVCLFFACLHFVEFFMKYGVLQRDKRRSMLAHFVGTMLFGVVYWYKIDRAQTRANSSFTPAIKKQS